MTTDTLDLPTITDPVPAVEPTSTAVTTTDLKKVDLQAVALAQFGDWRTDVAAAKTVLSTTVHDLSIPARIAEAKTLRQRLIGTPRAEVNKIAAALKSKLSKVSKAVGAEAESAVNAYDALDPLITPQIEAAEKRIEEERQRKEREEEQRIEGLKLAVDLKLDPWLDRCQEDGMTAERVQRGMDALGQLAMPAEFADVAVYWAERMSVTRRSMESRRLALAQAEVEAAQAAARAEQQRIAGIQARIADIQDAAMGLDQASSVDLSETRMIVAALDITEAVYQEFTALARVAQQATLAALDALHDAAVARENEEAAQRQAAVAALPPAPAPLCEMTPGLTPPDAQEGVADNPLQPEPAEELAVGDLAADGAGVEAGGTADEAPAAGRVILVEPDTNAIWSAALRGNGTEKLQAGEMLIRGELGIVDAGVTIVGNPPLSDDDRSLETSEADARKWTPPPGYFTTPSAPATDPRDEFVALVMSAFDCKFPTHPKPSQEWWSKVRAAGAALQREVA